MSASKWVQGDAEGAFTQLSLETGGNVESESFPREFSYSQSLGALVTLPELLMLVDVQRCSRKTNTAGGPFQEQTHGFKKTLAGSE